ncbi:MAG: GNAT family N-acetyltransferase [Dehalococcoidales bacterium]
MGCTVTQESFHSLTSYWADSSHRLKWGFVFVLPPWLEVWWRAFQSGSRLYLSAVRQEAEIIGIAPLHVRERKAAFIGSADVCDYLDFIIVPGQEKAFFNALLDDLVAQDVKQLNLDSLRPDSATLVYLVEIARRRGYLVETVQEDVSLAMELPATWEDYLASLAKKQRHEVRRKLRRLHEAGNADYRCLQVEQSETEGLTDMFLRLFSQSRQDKANFMTARMEKFFRSLALAMAEIGILRYGILELDALPVAMIMAFDYNETKYLYNSAFMPHYDSLSIGLLSKVLSIRESINAGLKHWDFLKGAEDYKYQLGGHEIPLINCRITLR